MRAHQFGYSPRFVQDADGGSYELITFNADASAPADASGTHRGPGLAAVFVARNRFAVLDKNRQVLMRKSFCQFYLLGQNESC